MILDLLQQFPKDLGLIRKLGNIRIRNDDRSGAVQVLESGLKRCCTPGTCGSQPFDIHSARLLARIYLEERSNPERSKELLKEIQRYSQQITWEDQYLSALFARNEAHPFTAHEIQQLISPLGKNDPRREWVNTHFHSYLSKIGSTISTVN